MAFTLRWPVLCVWLHARDSPHSSSRSPPSRSSSSRGIICLGGYGKHGHHPLPFTRTEPLHALQHGEMEETEGESGALSSDDLLKLSSFSFSGDCKDGYVTVQLLKPQHMRGTVELLTDSFCELLWGPLTYRPVLQFIVRDNLVESQKLFPKNVVLVAMHTSQTSPSKVLVGTVELYLSNANVSSPRPPRDGASFLCNMAVRQDYRRRGIGWQLLRAAERLSVTMGRRDIYLHCRLVDKAPLEMYQRAGYKVVTTTNLLASLITLQRRKHLMHKSLEKSEVLGEYQKNSNIHEQSVNVQEST